MSSATTTATELAAHEITLTRVLNARRDLVFRAWTDPKHLVRWWGPHEFTVQSCAMDVREGGTWRICIRSPESEDYWMHGVYHEIRAPEKLVFSFQWDKDGKPRVEMRVTVTLEEAPGGRTLLTFHETGFADAEMREMDNGGWTQCLERLDSYTGSLLPESH
ncbi:MAG: SRPBCC domain-containing protein [Pedobacter sp.]|nr:SRPBCC domain-containing protein [Pedobacter sp.]